jgi:hypothetical protein
VGKDMGVSLATRDKVKVKAAYDNAMSKFNEIKTRANAIKAPRMPGAKELHDAFQESMKNQERSLKNELKEIVDMVVADRIDEGRITEIGQAMLEMEIRDLASLRAAQQDFINKNGLAAR